MSTLEGVLVPDLRAAGFSRKPPCEKNTAVGWPQGRSPGQHLPLGIHLDGTQGLPYFLNQRLAHVIQVRPSGLGGLPELVARVLPGHLLEASWGWAEGQEMAPHSRGGSAARKDRLIRDPLGYLTTGV